MSIPRITPTQVAVLQHLNDTANDRNVTSESLLDIGLHVARSASSVRNAIDRLAQNGYIKKMKAGKKTSKGVYLLTQQGLDFLASMGIQRACNHAGGKPLPDMFRSPALTVAGQLYMMAPKEVGLTRKQVLGLKIISGTSTLLRYVRMLQELPHPLITVSLDPTVTGRKLYTFHALTEQAEAENLAYLQMIPGTTPKTYATHEEENTRRKLGYVEYLGGVVDMKHLYETEVKPHITTRPDRLGCELFTGHLNKGGYGEVKHGRTHWAAHRIAWVAQCGEEQPGTDLHHWCGVPQCVSVHHLNPLSREDHRALHRGEECRVIIPQLWQQKTEESAA